MNRSTWFALLALGLLAAALPLRWMTLASEGLEFSLGDTAMPELAGLFGGPVVVHLTGLEGSVSLGLTLPLWFVVALGLGGSSLSLLASLGLPGVPRVTVGLLLAVSAAFVATALLVALGDPEATLGPGAPAAAVGLVLAFASLVPVRRAPASGA